MAKGSGMPVLFLHGYTASLAMWSATVDALSGAYNCLTMDLRGHGKSQSASRESYSLAAMAEDALRVLNENEVEERAVIVGHSLGGMIAQHLAVHHQDRISGLVLSSTTCFAPGRERFTPLIEGAVNLAHMTPEERQADPALMHSLPLDEDTAWGCGEAIMNLPRYDLDLGDFPFPAMAIYGDQDSENILKGSKQLIAALPDWSESIIVGAGHVPQISHPEAYAEALMDFLKDIASDD